MSSWPLTHSPSSPGEHLWLQRWKMLFWESPQTWLRSPAARDAGGCAPALPCQGPVTELLSINLSNPFLSQCCVRCQALGRRSFGSSLLTVGRDTLQHVDGVFSIKDVWKWDLLGSLTSNDQQFRMKLLTLCSGLHEKKKKPHKVPARL